jgi:membrane fusion protein (multidrug efflux system)
VIANYKETQVKRMQVGQRATIKVDGIPDHTFVGIVDSFAPASGSTFSLIPPDNATGNFTKIVQRIPVKIRFDEDSVKGFENKLFIGMSVVANVDVLSKIEKPSLARQRELDNPLKKVMPYFW